jgi:hypothetical protein
LVNPTISPITVAEPDSLDPAPAPGTPIVTITPPAENTEQFPSPPHVPTSSDPPVIAQTTSPPSSPVATTKASTIDEAVANFHDALGKGSGDGDAPMAFQGSTEDDSLPTADSVTPVDEVLREVEADDNVERPEYRSSPTIEADGVHTPLPSTASSPPPFRKHPSANGTIPQISVQDSPGNDSRTSADGEEHTMDEIDLN